MTAVSPDARTTWRAVRTPLAFVLVIVAVGIVIALAQSTSQGGALDPRSAAPDGARAVANLLRDEGIDVEPIHAADKAAAAVREGGATLLITHPDLLDPADLRRMASDAQEAVLLAPGARAARAVIPGARTAGNPGEESREPSCGLEAATAAGTATMGGKAYRASGAQACYPAGDGASLLRSSEDAQATLLGTGTPLTNEALAEDGNAALALRLLGARERLVWYVPTPGDPSLNNDEKSLTELLPDGWKFAGLQLAIAAVLFALWRARRLGPVVTEPLPVVVHAAETTEGRALLYRRGHTTDHAASALRAATRGRVAAALGLSPDAEPDAVVSAAAARSGSPPDQIRELLYGRPPGGDSDLVRLADALDTLESKVRQR